MICRIPKEPEDLFNDPTFKEDIELELTLNPSFNINDKKDELSKGNIYEYQPCVFDMSDVRSFTKSDNEHVFVTIDAIGTIEVFCLYTDFKLLFAQFQARTIIDYKNLIVQHGDTTEDDQKGHDENRAV